MHTHYYTFAGDTHKEIGTQIGETFRQEIQEAMYQLHQSPKWNTSREIDLESFQFTKQYFPTYAEELEGYARGASLDLLDAWSLCIEDESAAYVEDNPAHCTTIITNGGLLIGHNEDANSEADQDKLSVVLKVLPEVTTLELFYATSLGGTAIGLNSHGFAQTINTLFRSRVQKGVPRVVISRFLLETDDPARDLSIVSKIPKMSGYHHAIVKSTGEMWNVEFNSSNENVMKQRVPYVHTNHCVFDPSHTFPDDWGTQTRYKRACDLVKDNMSLEEVQLLLRDTSTTPKKIFNPYTMAEMIIDYRSDKILIWLRREAEKEWVEYPLP